MKFWLEGDVQNGIISAGYLLVSYQTMKGYVCADNWQWNSRNMRVACGQLGFPEALNLRAERSDGPFILNGLNCKGTESSMLSCNHSGFAQSQQACRSNAAVWLKCKVFNRTAKFKNVGLCYTYSFGFVPWHNVTILAENSWQLWEKPRTQ